MTALYKVVMTSTVSNEYSNPFVNVFGYRSNIIVLDEAKELADHFASDVVPEIAAVLSNAMKIRRIEVYNVTDGVGYYDKTLATPVSGGVSGEALPGFVAWGFQYNRITAGKRHGFKRFGLIPDSFTDGDSATVSALTFLNSVAATLSGPIKIGLIDTWFPEILERKPTGVYPWTSHPILNVQYKRITTQNSRKR